MEFRKDFSAVGPAYLELFFSKIRRHDEEENRLRRTAIKVCCAGLEVVFESWITGMMDTNMDTNEKEATASML